MNETSLVMDKRGRVLLPKKMRAKLGFYKGMKVKAELQGDTIILTPLPTIPLTR